MINAAELRETLNVLRSAIEVTFNNNSWSRSIPLLNIFGQGSPFYSLEFVTLRMKATSELIDRISADSASNDDEELLRVYLAQLKQVSPSTLTASPSPAFGALMAILDSVDSYVLGHAQPQPQPTINWEDIKDTELVPKDLLKRLKTIETRIKLFEPRTLQIEHKLDDIDAAYDTAVKLPADRDDIIIIRNEIKNLNGEIGEKWINIQHIEAEAESRLFKIDDYIKKAEHLNIRSESALRGSTGVGLASAFETRKTGLNKAAIAWVVGLVFSLGVALVIGAERVAALKDVLVEGRLNTTILVNAILAVFGVGAPVWFAWLSTKQIGNSLRLAEDYAFKSAVSKAYEGYRTEAAQLDVALQNRLFSAALDRFEEPPIRLIDSEVHSTPLQELLSNPSIRKALENIPGIADKIVALIPGRGESAAIIAPISNVARVLNDDSQSKGTTSSQT